MLIFSLKRSWVCILEFKNELDSGHFQAALSKIIFWTHFVLLTPIINFAVLTIFMSILII